MENLGISNTHSRSMTAKEMLAKPLGAKEKLPELFNLAVQLSIARNAKDSLIACD